jgi:beta-N-acetylhexosaminidase
MRVATPSPIVVGCSGPSLSAAERSFFEAADPLGFILFARNVMDPKQVRALVDELRATVGRSDAPVLIDQEGGRVARLKPPHWRAAPPGGRIGALVETQGVAAACEAAHVNSQLLAAELIELGIDVDCAPVVDVPVADAHDIIGDRAYSKDPALVAKIARAAAEGLLAGGVMPIIKHIPGHGRARADSHAELPVVGEPIPVLEASDFAAFRPLADMPWAMTAHVLYTAIDRERPATTSPRVVKDIIRGSIGFNGVLVSDDLSMRALDGELPDRATAALAAGCDIVLHCTGVLEEMQAIAKALPPMSPDAARRIAAANAMRPKPPARVDREALAARLDALLGAGKPVS